MSLLSTIAGTENVSLTKINAVINTVNEFGGGAINQRLVKSSANDFDVEYANPENIAKYTGIAFALNTIVVGDAYNFATNQSTYVGNANQLVKIYSLATPSKYLIALLEDGTTTTNLVARIQVNSSNTDATSISDWVIVPYRYDDDIITINVTNSSTYPNAIFSTAPTITGGTVGDLNYTLIKAGNTITLQGWGTLTASGTGFNRRFTLGNLLDKWKIKEGSTTTIFGIGNAMYLRSGLPYSFPLALINGTIGSPSETELKFADGGVSFASVNAETITYNFSITYLSNG